MYLVFDDLFEAAMNDINDDIDLLHAHLVITWQAKSSFKDVCANICQTGGLYIGIASCSSVTFYSNKRIISIDWLHMHRLPDWSSFSI